MSYDDKVIDHLEVSLDNVAANTEAKFNKQIFKELIVVMLVYVADLAHHLKMSKDDYMKLAEAFFVEQDVKKVISNKNKDLN